MQVDLSKSEIGRYGHSMPQQYIPKYYWMEELKLKRQVGQGQLNRFNKIEVKP